MPSMTTGPSRLGGAERGTSAPRSSADTRVIRRVTPAGARIFSGARFRPYPADVRRLRTATVLPLYISVQVETAWGKLGQQRSYVGIDQDLRDFRFVNVLGLSSYPYLGGFKDPDQIPLDYYSRVRGSRTLPVMVVEGGWPSASVRGVFSSSPDVQARYVARQSQLLDEAKAIGVFQLSFTDLDLGSFPKPVPAILPLFATLGLVDVNLKPKPSLNTWDKIFARRLQR